MTPHCKCWDDPNPPPGARCKLCKRVVPGEPEHTCHATACRVVVKPELLMCYAHWKMVPQRLKTAVYAAYRPGQCNDMSPSTTWHAAADAAIGYVAAKENRSMRPVEIEALRRLGYATTTDLFGAITVRSGAS